MKVNTCNFKTPTPNKKMQNIMKSEDVATRNTCNEKTQSEAESQEK